MTVYARHSMGFEDDYEVFEYDEIPDAVFQVFEVNSGTHWVRGPYELWVAVGEDDSVELTDEELLAEFGPVTDDEEQTTCCPICGTGGCAVHTRRPSAVTDDRAEALVLLGGEA